MTMMSQGVSMPPWGNLPVSGVDVGGDDMRYLYPPCNYLVGAGTEDEEEAAVDAYSCDEFRMYDFKVRRCARGGSHDWTECPFAHPGEKARRRDPRKYHYSGTACRDFRKAGCSRGDACEYAHGVFECWLHPARYRTQPCKDGTACRRRVCFFAHTADQRRAMPSQHSSATTKPLSPMDVSYDGSPLRRQAFENYISNSIMSSSPTTTLLSSPPNSPSFPDSWPDIGSPVNELLASLRQLHLAKVQASPSAGWSANHGSPAAYGSPKAAGTYSLPTTPLSAPTTASCFMANMKPLNVSFIDDDGPVRRVESGRALREKVSERLSRDGAPPARCDTGAGARGPHVGWVSDQIN